MSVLSGFGFGAGLALLAVAAVVQAARSGQARPLAFLAGALLGLTALSGLFTYDLGREVARFAALPPYIRTTGSLLLALYVTIAMFVAVALLPLRSGLREGDLACRRYLLVYTGVLSLSVAYLYPAVWATGGGSVRSPGAAFTAYGETDLLHTPWLLGWQQASWLIVIVLGRAFVNRDAIRRYAILPAARDVRRRALLGWLVAALALGTLGEAFRGFWSVWASMASLLAIIALSIWQTWGLELPGQRGYGEPVIVVDRS